MATTKRANQEAVKALKWILRSGAATVFLTGLVTLLVSFQNGEITLQYLLIGVVVLAANGLINVIWYWNHEKQQ